jgi:hypothetical protein
MAAMSVQNIYRAEISTGQGQNVTTAVSGSEVDKYQV